MERCCTAPRTAGCIASSGPTAASLPNPPPVDPPRSPFDPVTVVVVVVVVVVMVVVGGSGREIGPGAYAPLGIERAATIVALNGWPDADPVGARKSVALRV